MFSERRYWGIAGSNGTDSIVLSISPSVCPVAVSEPSSLSTVILERHSLIHCVSFGRQRLPGLYPGRGLACHCNSFTKYLRDTGGFSWPVNNCSGWSRRRTFVTLITKVHIRILFWKSRVQSDPSTLSVALCSLLGANRRFGETSASVLRIECGCLFTTLCGVIL